MYKLYTFFDECIALVLYLQHFTFVLNQIVLTTMKRMLKRYADAIVKRGVDKLIDAIGHTSEPQTKNTETPQPQKRMGNDTDCAPQTTDNTTNGGLTEQTISLMDELCDFRYNVLDRTPEVQRRDMADKGFVPVSKQGAQPCFSLCEKPRRQPYVTYVAYVLMSPAVSGTRAKPKTASCPTRDASPPLERAFGGSVGCLSLRARRQHITTSAHYHIDEKIPATPREGA